jgi:transglutaminase-like putative cysteine protease
MRLMISHTTTYTFDDPVTSGMQQLRLTPRSAGHQQVDGWQVMVSGGVNQLSYVDHNQNHVDLVTFDKDTTELTISCHGIVDVEENHGVLGRHVGPTPLWLYKRMTLRTKAGTGVRGLLRAAEGSSPLERAHALMPVILDAVRYDKDAKAAAHRNAEETIADGHGVCQDHTHIFLACAREAGWPARYVSGYLALDGMSTQEAMHAWAEVYIEGLGWVGFDTSNKQSPDERYVRVAVGLDYNEAAPVTGRRIGGETENLAVAIEVAQQ